MSDCVNWSSGVGWPWLLTLHWIPGCWTQPHVPVLYQACSLIIWSFLFSSLPSSIYLTVICIRGGYDEKSEPQIRFVLHFICILYSNTLYIHLIQTTLRSLRDGIHLHMYSGQYFLFLWLQVRFESKFLWSGPSTATALQSSSGCWGQSVLYILSSIPLL